VTLAVVSDKGNKNDNDRKITGQSIWPVKLVNQLGKPQAGGPQAPPNSVALAE